MVKIGGGGALPVIRVYFVGLFFMLHWQMHPSSCDCLSIKINPPRLAIWTVCITGNVFSVLPFSYFVSAFSRGYMGAPPPHQAPPVHMPPMTSGPPPDMRGPPMDLRGQPMVEPRNMMVDPRAAPMMEPRGPPMEARGSCSYEALQPENVVYFERVFIKVACSHCF